MLRPGSIRWVQETVVGLLLRCREETRFGREVFGALHVDVVSMRVLVMIISSPTGLGRIEEQRVDVRVLVSLAVEERRLLFPGGVSLG